VNSVLISVALPPSRHIVDYAKAVQHAGADRLWMYDSPAVYGDVWIALARAAEATSLRLGTAVAVPSLRHPMVTAAAIASIEELAPGKLTVAMGTGFTARRAMRRKPITWKSFATIFTQIRPLAALSAGKPIRNCWPITCWPCCGNRVGCCWYLRRTSPTSACCARWMSCSPRLRHNGERILDERPLPAAKNTGAVA
jgi:Luciferase-like monooxygenase